MPTFYALPRRPARKSASPPPSSMARGSSRMTPLTPDSGNDDGAPGGNVTLSDDDEDGHSDENSSEGEDESDGDGEESNEEGSEQGEEDQDEDGSSSEGENEESENENDGEESGEESDNNEEESDAEELDEESEVEELEVSSSSDSDESSAASAEELDDNDSVASEDEASVEELDVDDNDDVASVDSSSDDEPTVEILDEGYSDEDDCSVTVNNLDDDPSVNDVDQSSSRRGSWPNMMGPSTLLKRRTSINGGGSGKPPPPSLSAASKSRSRFSSWMGRKKTPTPVPSAPPVSIADSQSSEKKHSSVNQERWKSNVEALKAYKAIYGDTNVPSAYGPLGSFVRNARALHNMPMHHEKRQNLTEERKRLLDEIDFDWVLTNKTHAYRKRSRNITRASSALRSMNLHGNTTPGEQGNTAHHLRKGGSSNSKADVAKRIAIHILNAEGMKSAGEEDASEAALADESIFRQGVSAGVTELELFEAFEGVAGKMDNMTFSGGKNCPTPSASPVKSSSGEGIPQELKPILVKKSSEGKKRKRDQDQRPANNLQACKKAMLEQYVEDGPKLRRSCLQREKDFDVWLADRKSKWKRQRKEKRALEATIVAAKSSLSNHPQSAENFQHWLSTRKVLWKEQRQIQRKKVTDRATEVVVVKTDQVKKPRKEKQPLDFRTCGVRQVRSGKWAVEISYMGKLRHVGTFQLQDHAALANRIARDTFKTSNSTEQTAEEITAKVDVARKVASNAVSKLDGGAHTRTAKGGKSTLNKSAEAKGGTEGAHNIDDQKDLQKVDQQADQSKEKKADQKKEKKADQKKVKKDNQKKEKEDDQEKRKEVKPVSMTGVTVDEMNSYLQRWLSSRPEHSLTPNLQQKQDIMKETGVTKVRLEQWFYRARKKKVASKSKGAKEVIDSGGLEVTETKEVLVQSPTENKATKKANDPRDNKKPKSSQSKSAKTKAAIPEGKTKTPTGLRKRDNGKWEVVIYYQGKKRYIGTFKSQDHAALANRIAREAFKTNNGSMLTAEEMKARVDVAREAASNAVSKLEKEEGPLASDVVREKSLASEVARENLVIKQIVKLSRESASIATSRSKGKVDRNGSSSDSGINPKAVLADSKPTTPHLVDSSRKEMPVVNPAKKSKQSERNLEAAPPMDFRTVGVRKMKSGKFEVGLRFHGNRRNLGTFDTRDHAALANEIGRKMLKTEKSLIKPTSEEIDQQVKLAREAVWKAVRRFKNEDDTPPNENEMFNVLLRLNDVAKESSDGPKLSASSDKVFEAWLVDRKNTWKEQRQRKRRKVGNEDSSK